MQIELLTSETARDRLGDLVELLQDAVDSGASVGFLPPLSGEVATDYWLSVVAELDAGHRLLLGAVDGARLVGAAQLELARKPNAMHRAEVQRLLVHRSVRRRGIGDRLMRRLEELARQRGRTLLVLDTRQGDASELLYQKLRYIRAGVIPGYARSGDGALAPTAFYFRQLEPVPGSAEWDDAPVFGSAPPHEPTRVRPSAYGLVTDSENRLAVVRTPQGVFLPGGGIEPGETPRDTVLREVLEECGFEVCVGSWNVRAVDVVYSPSEQSHFEKRSTFLDAHPSGRQATRREPDHELEWMPPPAAMGSLAHPSHRWAVEQWLARVVR
jgi:ribosomal protein S18 acetylase RimI-like enzyme/8-oxo-dGTP pyrophosphatase MutT (NUDIX family)